MNVTKKFVYLVLGSIPIIGIISILTNGLIGFILVNSLLAALLLGDYLISRGTMKVAVTRLGDEKLSVGKKEKISFCVKNESAYKQALEIIDEIPDYSFEASMPIMRLSLKPNEEQTTSYQVVANKRGAFQFGKVHVKLQSRLGLYCQYIKLPLEREYKVYPNLQGVKKYHLAAFRHLIEQAGRNNRHLKVNGTAFESLREYVIGDEYRKINWKASARANKLITNEYEPEKNQRVYMLIESGRPMSYTLRGQCKLDLAMNTALMLSDIINSHGDLSGLLSFNTKIDHFITAGKGANHRNQLMESLYHIQSTKLTSNYEDAFLHFKKEEKRKSILFLFTDFDTLEEAEIIAKSARIIERQHILVVVLMMDEKLEQLAQMQPTNEEEIYNKAVALELLEERKQAIHRLNHKNVMCVETSLEQLELTVINKYIEAKNRLKI